MPKGRPKSAKPGIRCPQCGRDKTVKDGKQRNIQRWRCTWVPDEGEPCEHRFQENGYRNPAEKERAFSEFHRISSAKESGLKSDLKFQDMAANRGLSRRTIGRWYKEWELLKSEEEKRYKKALIDVSKEKFLLEMRMLFAQAVLDLETLIVAISTQDRKSFIETSWSKLKYGAYRASDPMPWRKFQPLSDLDKRCRGTLQDWNSDNIPLTLDPDDISTYPSALHEVVNEIVEKSRGKSRSKHQY